jgi:hypothetical protein
MFMTHHRMHTVKICSNINERDRMRMCGVNSSGLAYELVNLASKLYSYSEISNSDENEFFHGYIYTDGQTKGI